jgi:hypothetical protein
VKRTYNSTQGDKDLGGSSGWYMDWLFDSSMIRPRPRLLACWLAKEQDALESGEPRRRLQVPHPTPVQVQRRIGDVAVA